MHALLLYPYTFAAEKDPLFTIVKNSSTSVLARTKASSVRQKNILLTIISEGYLRLRLVCPHNV